MRSWFLRSLTSRTLRLVPAVEPLPPLLTGTTPGTRCRGGGEGWAKDQVDDIKRWLCKACMIAL